MTAARSGVESDEFRRVLGHVPTVVTVVTGLDQDSLPIGVVIGAFTSVSLDPPLVGFFPARTSSTAPALLASGRFCVNVLAADQEAACRSFARSGGDKFDGVQWAPGPSGLPRLAGAVAWIECDVVETRAAGDHTFVLGAVTDLRADEDHLPMVFYQGGYGGFAPTTMTAVAEPDLVSQLSMVDRARPSLERLARQTSLECLASATVGDDVVVLASTGQPDPRRPPTRVGQRIPLAPPLGAPLVAWSAAAAERWVDCAGPSSSDRRRAELLLERVRTRGWSIGVGSEAHRDLERALRSLPLAPTPTDEAAVLQIVERLGDEYEPADVLGSSSTDDIAVRNLGVPVFGGGGQVLLLLSLYGFSRSTAPGDVRRHLDRLRAAATEISLQLPDAAPGTPPRKAHHT